jgi:hypothetical protein
MITGLHSWMDIRTSRQVTSTARPAPAAIERAH